MLIGYGNGVGRAWQVSKLLEKEEIKTGVIDLRFIKPLDEKLLKSIEAKTIFVFSDSVKLGGVAESLEAFYNENNITKKIISFEIEDKFIPHGQTKDIEKMLKIDVESLAQRVKQKIKL
jgi:1-deoxy-D-xylulose-5-phosphate synthase